MKLLALGLVAALAVGTPAFAGHGGDKNPPRSGMNSPTLNNNASCVGAERASRNSRGGDRGQGGFGPAQSDFVQGLNESGSNFGQWLKDSPFADRETCPTEGFDDE
jgi:hypothetical protein